MTPDERTLLSRFLDELGAARGVAKDGEADDMIRRAMSANPDAAYLLVQHAIVADQSLHAAQARIAELERQAPPPQQSSSFLPAAGTDPWHRQGQGQASSPMPQSYAPMPPEERPGLFSAQSGLGSFLRNAGTTAAGVAGGEMLFNGLSDLFGHRGGGMFGGGDGFAGRPEEVIVNNYNDGGDPGFDADGSFDDQGNW